MTQAEKMAKEHVQRVEAHDAYGSSEIELLVMLIQEVANTTRERGSVKWEDEEIGLGGKM